MVIFFELYLEILFIGMLSMYTPNKFRDYTFQTFSIGGFLIFCGTMFVPLSIVYVLLKPKKLLDDQEFKRKWGSVYEAYKY